MALRSLLLIAFAAPLAGAPAVRTYPLAAETVYTVTLALDEPTTCTFPGPLTALDGANVAPQPGDGVVVLLSYQPGRNFFSVRAAREGAKGGLNVVYRDKVYALRFIVGPDPDRSITFREKPPQLTPEQLSSFVERAKFFPWQTGRYPALTESVEHVLTGRVTTYRNFTATVAEVFRWEADNVIVFRLRLETRDNHPVFYKAARLGVRIGHDAWFAGTSDGSGAIPAQGGVDVYFAVQADLPAGAPFSPIVPAP